MSWFLGSLRLLQLLFAMSWVSEMGVSLGPAAPAGRQAGARGSDAAMAWGNQRLHVVGWIPQGQTQEQ